MKNKNKRKQRIICPICKREFVSEVFDDFIIDKERYPVINTFCSEKYRKKFEKAIKTYHT